MVWEQFQEKRCVLAMAVCPFFFHMFPGRGKEGSSSRDQLPGGLAKVVFFFFFVLFFLSFLLSGQISEVQ